MYEVSRITHACMAHRILGHAGRCKQLHGHNYRFTLTLRSPHLDTLEMLMDFGDIKQFWDKWIDENWDHHTILNSRDPLLKYFERAQKNSHALTEALGEAILSYDWNPTAEKMAKFLAENVREHLWRTSKLPTIYEIIVRVEETDGNTASFCMTVQGE